MSVVQVSLSDNTVIEKRKFVLKIFIVLSLSVFCIRFTGEAQITGDNVTTGLICLKQSDGETIWQRWFDRGKMPLEYRVVQGKVRITLYRPFTGAEPSSCCEDITPLYLDAQTGKDIAPFRQIDETDQGEIVLSNGWTSYGIERLKGLNDQINPVYFFDQSFELKWKMNLPKGAYDFTSWNNVVVYKKRGREGGQLVDRLFGQDAGHDSSKWNFVLPTDLAIQGEFLQGDASLPVSFSRSFTYINGKESIYLYGSGTLFALRPTTGEVEWHYTVSNDELVRHVNASFDRALIEDAGDDLILVSRRIMIRFDIATRRPDLVLRNDLLDIENPAALPICNGGFIYCFTSK